MVKNPTVHERKSINVRSKDEPMFVKKHRYNKAERASLVIECNAREGRTRQEFKNETDINVIMKRYANTGELPRFTPTRSGEIDYDITLQEAIHTIRDVQNAWNQIPVPIATRYPHWLQLANGIRTGEVIYNKETKSLTLKPKDTILPPPPIPEAKPKDTK